MPHMADPTSVRALIAVLADAMLGAIGPISPPNDVKGDRVKGWIANLTTISQSLSPDQANRELVNVVAENWVDEIDALRAELATVTAERDALLAGASSHSTSTVPTIPQAARWQPATPKRSRQGSIVTEPKHSQE